VKIMSAPASAYARARSIAHAFDAGRVGARTDDEVRVTSRGYRRAQALYHVVGRDDGLAVEVPAPLRVDLILYVASGQYGVLEDGHGARGVQGHTESGVRVDQCGQVRGSGDLRTARGDLRQSRQSDVRQSEVGRQRCAGHVDSLEAGLGDRLGHQRRECARKSLQPTGIQTRSQRGALVGGAGHSPE
jgi:hypothetical protein